MPAWKCYENIWHRRHLAPRTAFGSVLRLVEAPPIGGDPMWTDLAAAYDNLPAHVRERINRLTAVHDFVPGFEPFTDPAAPKTASRPSSTRSSASTLRRAGGRCS